MFTRCPGCSTVHPVNAAILAQNGGMIRCGKCNKTSNALESLFDEWPDAGREPPSRGELPVLGTSIDLEKAGQSRLNPEDAGLTGDESEFAPGKSGIARFIQRVVWLIGGIVVGGFIIFKLAEFSGYPILEQREIDAVMIRLGLQEPAPVTLFRDLDMIHLVSRELAGDPARPGLLTLKATIVNRASRSQPYPELEVILFDAEGAELAIYGFNPDDYLAKGSDPGASMSPHAYLPLVLELQDPGVQAVGFELNFH